MKSRPVAFAVMGLTLGVLAVLLLVSILQTRMLVGEVRNTQKTNTGTVRLIKAQGRAIRDCTDPTGECFKRAKRQTAGAVNDINKISVYAAACADQSGVQTASEIYACVVERLAKDKP